MSADRTLRIRDAAGDVMSADRGVDGYRAVLFVSTVTSQLL
jgi:hypothetical protein